MGIIILRRRREKEFFFSSPASPAAVYLQFSYTDKLIDDRA